MVFAKEPSFDIYGLEATLQEKNHVQVLQVNAMHGFMDNDSEMYDAKANDIANDYITKFLEYIM